MVKKTEEKKNVKKNQTKAKKVAKKKSEVTKKDAKKEIVAVTNEFAKRVTEENDMGRRKRARWINELFAVDGTLRPTVGQVVRTQKSKPTTIEAYFRDYFSASVIRGLKVVKAEYNIVKIRNDLYANYAYVKFDTRGENYLTAVMSFIFEKDIKTKTWKIKLLHSQPIHLEVPESLVKQGDVFPYWELQKPYGNL